MADELGANGWMRSLHRPIAGGLWERGGGLTSGSRRGSGGTCSCAIPIAAVLGEVSNQIYACLTKPIASECSPRESPEGERERG